MQISFRLELQNEVYVSKIVGLQRPLPAPPVRPMPTFVKTAADVQFEQVEIRGGGERPVVDKTGLLPSTS